MSTTATSETLSPPLCCRAAAASPPPPPVVTVWATWAARAIALPEPCAIKGRAAEWAVGGAPEQGRARSRGAPLAQGRDLDGQIAGVRVGGPVASAARNLATSCSSRVASAETDS